MNQPTSPAKLCVVIRMDGTIEDVAVMARDPQARAEGIALLNDIQLELAAFERAIPKRLAEVETAYRATKQ